jgi:hypothetical protein
VGVRRIRPPNRQRHQLNRPAHDRGTPRPRREVGKWSACRSGAHDLHPLRLPAGSRSLPVTRTGHSGPRPHPSQPDRASSEPSCTRPPFLRRCQTRGTSSSSSPSSSSTTRVTTGNVDGTGSPSWPRPLWTPDSTDPGSRAGRTAQAALSRSARTVPPRLRRRLRADQRWRPADQTYAPTSTARTTGIYSLCVPFSSGQPADFAKVNWSTLKAS